MPRILDNWTREWAKNKDCNTYLKEKLMCGCNAEKVTIGFKRINTGAQIPTRATSGSAGYDCYLPETCPPINAGEIRIVKLGFALEIPEGYCVRIVPRSGLASKGLLIANSPGLLDSDFRGEIGVILWSVGGIFPLNKGDRICQMTIEKAPESEFVVIDELSDSDRGEGGFGSTGIGEQK